ncbi:GNAT family N-acetyltransferase [Fodinicola acaciae]|uniref:GNAT family N-acetyltransferase n=1 Tax=Fodinicola acaciae TaxID=2681555 RepID=UPI001C9E3157|nr:GNAT family N-acetyltransferase [Fodinicola acaciae]
MQVFLETERLVLRRLTADDIDNLVEVDSDPDVELGYRLRKSAWGKGLWHRGIARVDPLVVSETGCRNRRAISETHH